MSRCYTGHFMCYLAFAESILHVVGADTHAMKAIADGVTGGSGASVSIENASSTEPTTADEEASIALRFSLLMEDSWSEIGSSAEAGDDYKTRRHIISADGIENWSSSKTISSVTFSLIRVLCNETDFGIIDHEGEDFCESLKTDNGRVVESGEEEDNVLHVDDEVIVATIALIASLEAFDRSHTIENNVYLGDHAGNRRQYALNWTEWKVSFPILSTGSQYQKQAMEEDGALLTGASVWDRAAALMEADAQMGLDIWIADGSFDLLLLEDGQGILKSSIVGMEASAFMSTVQEVAYDGGYTELLCPAPFHPIRVAGIIMCIGTILFAISLPVIARSRRRERELDEVRKKRGRGGRVASTEEGLSMMPTMEGVAEGRAGSSSMDDSGAEGYTTAEEGDDQGNGTNTVVDEVVRVNAPPVGIQIERGPKEGVMGDFGADGDVIMTDISTSPNTRAVYNLLTGLHVIGAIQ